MSPDRYARRDARHCPECGALGILPLDQDTGEPDGAIVDPVMLCPVCGVEYRATGMTYFDIIVGGG